MEGFIWLTAEDSCKLYVKHWGSGLKTPKAVIQISHGMAEHINRYHDFARYLNRQGYIVYGDDHRGHGKTGERQGQLGYFADDNGFDLIVEDMYLVTKRIKHEHPDLPIFIFGHSMGSFITRNFLQKYSQAVSGVILSGTGFFPKASSYAGMKIASLLPPRKESKIMNKVVFGNYNNRIEKPATSFDWLSRDVDLVTEYIKDPYAGFIPTAKFFVDLLTGIIRMQDKERNQYIRKDLPILFLSGDKDPVGNYSKGVFRAAERYYQAGIENIIIKLYSEARHELQHETNKKEVYQAVKQWVNSQLTGA